MANTSLPSGADIAGLARYQSENFSGTPELFSGDTPLPVTDWENVGADANIPAFSVVGRLGNDPDGVLALATYVGAAIGDAGEAVASGALTIAAQLTAGDTVTIGGVVFTAMAAGTADAAGEFNLGVDAATTAANLLAAINGDDAFNDPHPTVNATLSGLVITVRANESGAEGNAIATTDVAAQASWGGGTLTGGTDTAGGGILPIGVTCVEIVTTAGVATKGPIFYAGCFNPNKLNWHASFNTDAKKRQAFRGSPTPTNIVIKKPRYPESFDAV